jgi:hypothetical protein
MFSKVTYVLNIIYRRPVNLQQALLEQSGPVPAPGGTREVTALYVLVFVSVYNGLLNYNRTGHILFAPSASSGSSFLPPVAGSLPFDGALQSIESAGLIRAFVPRQVYLRQAPSSAIFTYVFQRSPRRYGCCAFSKLESTSAHVSSYFERDLVEPGFWHWKQDFDPRYPNKPG